MIDSSRRDVSVSFTAFMSCGSSIGLRGAYFGSFAALSSTAVTAAMISSWPPAEVVSERANASSLSL